MSTNTTKGLGIERFFSKEDLSPYDSVEWETGPVRILNDKGEVLFIQEDTEWPKNWSQYARDISASRYFFGRPDTEQREGSGRQLISRVSDTLANWANTQGYFSSPEQADIFRDELAAIALGQGGAFNSPVWFNLGTDAYGPAHVSESRKAYIIRDGRVQLAKTLEEKARPQTSACFIQSVEDTMESIMDLAGREAAVFKYGSGTGTNLSSLRSAKEDLSTGGAPSGPLAYLIFYDNVAWVVKSGGKTRRAAKMNILNTEHPDILEFILAKTEEQSLINALVAAGYDSAKARERGWYQNTNVSVRATDVFMQAVERGEVWQTVPVHSQHLAGRMPPHKASDLMDKIAEGTHYCGDPGMQFHDTINAMHTCPRSGPINASNPCSEFMFLDDSACNLASLNLMTYVKQDGSFDIDAFNNAIRTMIIAQEALIDESSYPTKKIARNSHRFRPLGLGYSNLGTLLMTQGMPYDSDEARATAAAITAQLTAKAYLTSTEMAEQLGPFKEFKKNRKSMLEVIRKHQKALDDIDIEKIPEHLRPVYHTAKKTWAEVVERGEKHGFRNAQATLLAPTGTISFMMDCDTTGIEPELGLVKTKVLAEGGVLEIENQSVGTALRRLEYEDSAVSSILTHLKEKGTLEGSGIKGEHLPIFDCSFKPGEGGRFISPHGHIGMMAATQPFLSGAISKTVNVPKEFTPEQIRGIYMDAWREGVKSIAIYRDGSKVGQPLTVGKKDRLEDKLAQGPQRRRMPNERDAKIHKFTIGDHEFYITPGFFEEGGVGEMFLEAAKEGSMLGGLLHAFGISVSLGLQHGVPLETFGRKFVGMKFDPRGFIPNGEGHPEIPEAKSPVDYMFQYLLMKDRQSREGATEETGSDTEEDLPKITPTTPIAELGEKGGLCPRCGDQTYKQGSCAEYCRTCNKKYDNGCGG